MLELVYNRCLELVIRGGETIEESFGQLVSEVGELSTEIFMPQRGGPDGKRGESIDTIIAALTVYVQDGGTSEELANWFNKKLDKWEDHLRIKGK